MSGIAFPEGIRLELLRRGHPRKHFRCGEEQVDDWLAAKALQNQQKHLSTTKVLLDADDAIAGYYTLATGQVDFGDLPAEIAKGLSRRALPVAVLAWMGVSTDHQGHGLGKRLLAQAFRDCWEAGQAFAFIAVILNCLTEKAKAFYQHHDFAELPGHPFRLYLSVKLLDAMLED